MEFESPDVEREFPGLYASESASGKRSQESDFSDDAHERSTKKELLIGKRKDKKESKKDQGYAALEGESSPEEELDVKSPYKSKKTKSFKFPTIKEKREKSREKDVKDKEKDKEKEKDKDKDVDRDKEKKKESKSKLKLKDKKKIKTCDDVTETLDEMPVFGVSLLVAIDRSRCHDGVEIPVVVRDCIDHIQDCGLSVEGIYKMSGVKSKVQQLRRSYNKRETVKLSDYDISTVTSLLKTFLRELPDPLLTTDLTPKFDEIVKVEAAIRDPELLCSLIAQLPSCNLTCLSWLIRHLESVTANESHNKMGVNALGTIFGPVLQTSPRVVGALITLSSTLFPNVRLVRYIPPLTAGCTSLPKSREAITAELTKQDSLLNQIHSEMNHGWTMRSDQLWEVQRFVTQLKRQLKCLEKAQEISNQTPDEPLTKSDPIALVASGTIATKNAPISPSLDDKIDFQLQAPDEGGLKGGTSSDVEDLTVKETSTETSQKPEARDEADAPSSNIGEGNSEYATSTLPVPRTSPVSFPAPAQEQAPAPVHVSSPATASPPAPAPVSDQTEHASTAESDEKGSESHLQLEYIELMKLQAYLTSRILQEREQVESLRIELSSLANSLPETSVHNISPRNCDVKTPVENLETSIDEADAEPEEKKKEREDLCKQNAQLMQDRLNLVRQIMLEHEKCINLRVQLGLHQVAESK